MKRINELITEEKYEQCLAIIRQMLIREENPSVKLRLYWLNSQCLMRVGRNKEAERSLTRLLNE
jgi:methionine synthase II (cobalamin-independent)